MAVSDMPPPGPPPHWPPAPPGWPPAPPGWPPAPQWPSAGPPPHRSSNLARYLVAAALAVLLAAFAVLVIATKEQWTGSAPVDGTEMTFRATQPDGSPPTPEELARTQHVLSDRTAALGISDASVVADGDILTVTVPGDGRDVVDIAGQASRFDLRPVIHVIPAEPGGAATSAPQTPQNPDPARVQEEKQLRQSIDDTIQILGLQFQASRCGDSDALAGNDDPELPLITCSQDGSEVYLLDASMIDGEQIAGATSGFDQQSGQYVVNLEFTADAADTWADYTAKNIGAQTAFVLDTKVVSAPVIQSAIPGGRTQITGQFTEKSARELAAVLDGGRLPLTLNLESSSTTMVPGAKGSTPLRIALGGAGALVVLTAIGAFTYLAVSGSRRRR